MHKYPKVNNLEHIDEYYFIHNYYLNKLDI